MPYTVSEILTQLATNHRWFRHEPSLVSPRTIVGSTNARKLNDMNFPLRGNGYTYPADVNLTAYRDATR
jgi:hypothetical protein